MKIVQYFKALALFSLLSACTAEKENSVVPGPEEEPSDTGRREVLLTFRNKLAVKSEATKAIATKAENEITSMDIYVFGCATEEGDYTYRERFAYREKGKDVPADATELELAANADGSSVTTLLSLQKGLFVRLYCIANQPDLVDPANEGTILDDSAFVPLEFVKEGDHGGKVTKEGVPQESTFLTYHSPLITEGSAVSLGVPLPMTGAYTTPLDLTDFTLSSRVQAGFKLTRTVARFDVSNDATTSHFTLESVSMGNGRKGVGYFPLRVYGTLPKAIDGELVTYPYQTVAGDNLNKGLCESVFYSYPSPIADEGYLILKGKYNVNLTQQEEVSYRIPFKQASTDGKGSFIEVTENHRYTILISDADPYHLDFDIKVADWSDAGNIDDWDPEANPNDFKVEFDATKFVNTSYDESTHTVNMALDAGSEFTLKTGTNSILTYTISYDGNKKGYEWLDVKEELLSKAIVHSKTYQYTVSLKPGYTKNSYPRASIRFIDSATATEKVLLVQAVASPEIEATEQEVGNINSVLVNKNDTLITMFRIADSKVKVNFRCPDGVVLDDNSKPAWLDVTSIVNGAQTQFELSLNDINANTGTADNMIELVFQNKAVAELKTKIKLLLQGNIEPDFSNLGGDTGNTYTASPDNGVTPDDIKMPIKTGNTFSVACESPKGIKVDINYGSGTAGWLSFSGADPYTKALASNSLKFSLVDGKLSGATKATVTLKNNVAGKDYVFTVTPEFVVAELSQFAASEGSSYDTGTKKVILMAKKGIVTPSVTLSVNCPGGSKWVDLPAWITVDKTESATTTSTYKLDLNVAHIDFPTTNPGDLTVKVQNLSAADKEETVTLSLVDEVYYEDATCTLTGTNFETSVDKTTLRVGTVGGKVTVNVNSLFVVPTVTKEYDVTYGDGQSWLTAEVPATATVVNNRRQYAVTATVAATTGTDASYQVHKGAIEIKNSSATIKKYVVYRGASWVTYPVASKRYYAAVAFGGKNWAPVNVGATKISVSAVNDGVAGNGYYYQWGRNKGFTYNGNPGDVYTGTDFPQTPQASMSAPWNGQFIKGTSASDYNWALKGASGLDEFWPQNGKKSVANDPCPAGWRVPTNAELTLLVGKGQHNGSSTDRMITIPGTNGINLLLPAAGYRYYDGSSGPLGTYGYFWSSSVNGTSARYVSFNSGLLLTGNFNRAYGFSVRCVQE